MTCTHRTQRVVTAHTLHEWGDGTWTWALVKGDVVLGWVWRRRHGPITVRVLFPVRDGEHDYTAPDAGSARAWLYTALGLLTHAANGGDLTLRHQWWPDDLTALDQRTWYALRKRVHDEVPPGLREDLLARLRVERASQRRQAVAWNWENRYADDRDALHTHLTRLVEATRADCVDNYRVAKLGHHRGLVHFARAKARGCCGSAEKVVRVGWLPPRWYKIGFDYGH